MVRRKKLGMSREQYRAALESLEITKADAMHALGVSKRTAERFASGEQPVPRPIAKLLRLMDRYHVSADEVENL